MRSPFPIATIRNTLLRRSFLLRRSLPWRLEGPLMIEITDAMLRAAVAVMEHDRIQGFSSPLDAERRTWGPPYIVRDMYLPGPEQVLWRGGSHDDMLERQRMEEMRLALRAALELVP